VQLPQIELLDAQPVTTGACLLNQGLGPAEW
jgi:hypothetical protein